MNYLKYLLVGVLAMALAACGGGGGSGGTLVTTPGSPGTPPPNIVSAADFIFQLDKTSIFNTGSDKAVLTVTALDSNRNVVMGVPVSVAVDGSGVFAPSSGSSTDVSGQFSGSIALGGDKSNRAINATITVGSITKVAAIVVTGSQISVTPVLATPLPGVSVAVDIFTTDNAGTPIQNASLILSGTAGLSGAVITGVSGTKRVTFSAPSTPGSYTIVVTGLGVSVTKFIQVVASGGGGIPPAVGTVSSASLTPTPSSINVNVAGSTANRSRLKAKILNGTNSGISNMRVRFEILSPSLGIDEQISTGTSTVYTDATGTAEADYIPGVRSSPTNGVVVTACYKPTDFVSTRGCSDGTLLATTLTAAGTPLSISITSDNTMTKGLGGIAYVKQFLIQVNDASGLAVVGAVVSPSVDITHYGKGAWNNPYSLPLPPTIRDLHLDDQHSNRPANFVLSLPASTQPPSNTQNIWCINEDWNRNGFLDIGEDVNNDGSLQPRKAEIIVSYVSGSKTDANGQLLIQISYGQNMGKWLAYTLRATTGVAGSEGDASKSYTTNVLQGDVANGSFLMPPFGIGACTSPN